ncbi:hypothetical protein CRG98_029966, partial [Punica granatum]
TSASPAEAASPSGIPARVWAMILAFFIHITTLMHLVVSRVTRKLLPSNTSGSNASDIPDPNMVGPREEIHRPPSPAPSFSKMDLLSSVWKRLGEVEDKVEMLQAKPHEMPYQKEELLNAAICRVDALEAELISTKKALYEALMKQEDLLAYIDSQSEAKLQKTSCW